MAIMFPKELSKDIIGDPRKQGEIKFYKCLQNRLGNDWVVFYSLLWFGKVYKSGNKRDGESDFIIANPKYGIIVAEIKGGEKIGFDGQLGQWFSINRLNKRHVIKDPYVQGRDNKYALIEEIKQLRAWKNYIGNINICNIAVFPEAGNINGLLPIHAKRELTVFEDDLVLIRNNLIKAIEYACNGFATDKHKTDMLIKELTHVFAPSLELSRKLVNYFADDEKEMITLTEAQYSTLRGLQKVNRASISGCAGSGKTLLAIKKSQMLLSEGKKIILCCYNTLLGKKLEKLLADSNCIAGSFYSVMYKILANIVDMDLNRLTSEIYDDNKLIELMLQYKLPQFEGIIVDELQDFSKNQVDIIEMLLEDNGVFYCFWDNNQRLLRADFSVPNDMIPFQLDTNLRNTKNIFNEVEKYYYEDFPIHHVGPIGRLVTYCEPYDHLRAKKLKQMLANKLHTLVFDEGVNPKDITVLTFKSKDQSALYDFQVPGLKFDIFNNDHEDDTIKIETARRYKGLESSVIIVTEMDDLNALNDNELWDNLCYVSFSRAKHYLIIMPPNNIEIC